MPPHTIHQQLESITAAALDDEEWAEDVNKPSPPLVSLSFSTKMCRSQYNTNEIAMISCIVHNSIN